ncbi:MAG: hypothetical protein CMN28_10050 [Salinisphaeraceae bacterium]|nr:hypothetical protein [Salinisphaeraceae bacterium]
MSKEEFKKAIRAANTDQEIHDAIMLLEPPPPGTFDQHGDPIAWWDEGRSNDCGADGKPE